MEAMRSSLSLDIKEKRQVVQAYPTLSRFQFDALLETWEDERKKFTKLAKDHPDDIAKLIARMEFEWALLLTPNLGAISFFSKYVFDEKSALSTDALLSAFELYSTTLALEDRETDIVVLIEALLAREDEIPAHHKVNMINAGFHALSRSGAVKDEAQLRSHYLFEEISTLPSDNPRLEKSKAFLRFCATSYIMDMRGLKDAASSGLALCEAYRRAGARSADLSSQMSTYFLLSGKFDRALSAAEICLKRYNSNGNFQVSNRHILQVAEHMGTRDVLNTNVIRNAVRYFVLLSCFGGADYEVKRRNFIREFFQETASHFSAWRPDKQIKYFSLFLVIYFFAEVKNPWLGPIMQRHIDQGAKESEKFLYRLAFSRPLQGGELDGLKIAMKDIEAKSDLLTYALAVRAISTSRLPLASDRAFVCDVVKKTYEEIVREKGWFLNDEAEIFNLRAPASV